jgi:hypothetical protein
MQLVVVPSECKIDLKRRLRDQGIAQELILDSDLHMFEDDVTRQSDNDTKENDRKYTGLTLQNLDLLHM